VATPIGPDDAHAFALAIQQDGKLVAAGDSYDASDFDFALVRYKANGQLDRSFGRGGKVATPIGPGDAHAFAFAIQQDGEIVAAGSGCERFALVRYWP
jgi:uncharacterized delta-60 repeat protein